MPEQRDEGGQQTYLLERIGEIAVLAAQRLTPREIESELARRHGDAPNSAASSDPWQAELIAEIRALRVAVERLADHFAPDDDGSA